MGVRLVRGLRASRVALRKVAQRIVDAYELAVAVVGGDAERGIELDLLGAATAL